jgi:hypothetical protein
MNKRQIYYQKNKDTIIQNTKKYRKENKEKCNIYNKRHYQKNKEKIKKQYLNNKLILNNLKINGCSMCGYDKCLSALDFHHIELKLKKFNITTNAMVRKYDILINELNKCVLLCSNCHRELHEKVRGDI